MKELARRDIKPIYAMAGDTVRMTYRDTAGETVVINHEAIAGEVINHMALFRLEAGEYGMKTGYVGLMGEKA